MYCEQAVQFGAGQKAPREISSRRWNGYNTYEFEGTERIFTYTTSREFEVELVVST